MHSPKKGRCSPRPLPWPRCLHPCLRAHANDLSRRSFDFHAETFKLDGSLRLTEENNNGEGDDCGSGQAESGGKMLPDQIFPKVEPNMINEQNYHNAHYRACNDCAHHRRQGDRYRCGHVVEHPGEREIDQALPITLPAINFASARQFSQCSWKADHFRCCLACISGRSFKTGAIVESEWSVF